LRLQALLGQVEKNIAFFTEKEKEWKQQFNSAKISNIVSEVKKFTDKIYWKHLHKSLTDKQYRADYSKVKIPTKLAADSKYRPMLEMFVENPDYRRQLTETVSTSIVYAKDPRVAKCADSVREFRLKESEKKLDCFKEKLGSLYEDKKMLKTLQKIIKS
jgi:arylamine N-acetyltransferase